MPPEGAPLRISYRTVCPEINFRAFRCGERDIDDWFAGDALQCETRGTVRVTCATLVGNDAPAGFFAVSTTVERTSKLPGFHYHLFGDGKYFPCLQLVYLAVQREFQGNGIGSTMAGSVIELFARVGPLIGLPHLILLPINEEVVSFYERLGFEKYDGGERMFLPLQSAVDAVSHEANAA